MNQNEVRIIDLSGIYNGDVTEIPFSFDIVPEDTETLDLTFSEPVKAAGKVYEKAHGKNKAESYVELILTVSGAYDTHCARCAKALHKEFSHERTYGVTKKLAEDSEIYVEAPGAKLNVGEIAETLFYLELPSRVLCKEDCQGLCPVCGTDLNEQKCTCKRNFGTNSLEDLKKLLDKS